jgi:hypothetical protein
VIDYRRLAVRALAKIKGYCPKQSTDEPQVLALAEQLERYGIADLDLIAAGITKLCDTPAAESPDFVVTPRMLTTACRNLRGRDPAAMTPEQRERLEALCDSKAACDECPHRQHVGDCLADGCTCVTNELGSGDRTALESQEIRQRRLDVSSYARQFGISGPEAEKRMAAQAAVGGNRSEAYLRALAQRQRAAAPPQYVPPPPVPDQIRTDGGTVRDDRRELAALATAQGHRHPVDAPAPLPCPDCQSLARCEHDEIERAEYRGDDAPTETTGYWPEGDLGDDPDGDIQGYNGP